MRKIEFSKTAGKRKVSIVKAVIKTFFNTALIAMVAFNTYSYNKLVTASYAQVLVKKVQVNADMINKLENDLLRQGASIDSLSVNPKELMEANVMVFTDVAKGSGSVIRVEKDYSYILTAAHVVSSTTYGRVNDRLDAITVVDEDITIYYGKDYKEKVRAKVQKIDYDVDVAVLKVFKKLDITPIKIAKDEPELGEVVWSISNPGSHEGVINKGIFSDIEEDYSYVALGGFFGSSGGMCLNNDGEQIGVISTVVIARVSGFFPSLTVYNGITRTANLNKFLKGLVR